MRRTYISLIVTILTLASCTKTNNQNILAIGDSNGAHEDGWVTQLQNIRINDSIINYSISGNTIGFNNLNKDTLNTIININTYIKNALSKKPYLDQIIILLGTNDCKAIFDSMQIEVVNNLDSLISIVSHYNYPVKNPQITLITPPPAADDSLLIAKYYGLNNRLTNLLPHYKKIAEKYSCNFIDIYTPLAGGFDTLNIDGIHLNKNGYVKMATLINSQLP